METVLRSLVYDDIRYMKEFFEDSDISSQFKFTKKPYSEKTLRDFVDNSNGDVDIHMAIEYDGEYAGTISLKNCDFVNKKCEYAIVLRKKFWSKGISKDASNKIIDYAFDVLEFNKVYLNVMSSNVRAMKFYKKIGFQFEGTFKKHLLIDNEFIDIDWYAIFNKKMEGQK